MEADIQIHDRPSAVSRFFTRMRQDYQLQQDYGTPYPSVRWAVTVLIGLIYILPIFMIQGFYIITYVLGIHLFNWFIGFLWQKINSGMELDSGILKSADPAIDRLPDPLLAEIFSYLPLEDRYQLRLVCQRWDGASRVFWTDITRLSLNTLPRAMVNPILGLCPNIDSIEAKDLIILVKNKLNLSTHENVRTMELSNVKFVMPLLSAARYDYVNASFGEYLERFPNLAELTLLNISLPDVGRCPYSLPSSTAMSLQCFVFCQSAWPIFCDASLNISRMENLQCLYLDDKDTHLPRFAQFELPQLRELCVFSKDFTDLAEAVADGEFPKLEVLIYASDSSLEHTALSQLMTAESALRILVIAGKDRELAQMRRKRYEYDGFYDPSQFPVTLPPPDSLPHPNNAKRSRAPPPLQIFVGGDFARNVRFTLPPSHVAKFWRIDCQMPEYLVKPEVAEVFKDVFVAKVIREGPENGLKPWGYPGKTDLFYSTEPLFFRFADS